MTKKDKKEYIKQWIAYCKAIRKNIDNSLAREISKSTKQND